MKTSLGNLSPTMIDRVRSGRIAEVAQEIVDKARANDASPVAQEIAKDPAGALSKLLGELHVLHTQYAANDKARVASSTVGVNEAGAGKMANTHGQRNVGTSPLAIARFGNAAQQTKVAPKVEVPSPDVAALQLRVVYARFPSLQVDLDPARLAVAAEKVFGAGDPATVRGLVELLATDKAGFIAARATAIDQPMTVQAPPRRAVVSGLSNGGMVAVALLAKSGYQVDAFEMRSSYTRNIQYGGRQALIDQLTSIDPKLADLFLERVGHHVAKGSIHTLNGTRRVHEMPKPEKGDATRVPATGEEMLAQASTVLMECKQFENVLHEHLQSLPNVTLHDNATVRLDGPDDKGNFAATNAATGESLGVPDLVVVGEGGNSSTFRSLGVKSAATSPQERYIAGFVAQDSGGVMAKHFRDVEGVDGPERVLIASMANAGAGKTWICAGVAKGVTFDPVDVDPRAPEYQQKQRDLVEKEFRHSAALVMETTPEAIANAAVHGPIGESGQPTLFTLQQRISETAVVGNNVVGFGDVVGNNHFSVGGGMQVAAIAHGQRLKKLLFEIELGGDKGKALAAYDKGALEDTMAWGKRGISDFYPYHSWQDASKAYVLAIAQWREGKVKDPLEALEKIMAKMPHMPPVGADAKRTAA